MITGSNCDCLVCRIEKSLIADFGEERLSNECRLLAGSSILSRFRSPIDLVRALHTPEDHHDSSSSDALLSELLRRNSAAPPSSLWPRLLLLVFIPTIHRTTSQITAAFRSLARDDTSQHVVTVFLEFLASAELQRRRSHLAFTIARKLRRKAFRWAIHESRAAAPDVAEGYPTTDAVDVAAEEPLHAGILLQKFLDDCQTMGWLSVEERNLLVDCKVKGVSCSELSRRNGHSAVATQHRIQRLLGKLQRLAQRTRWQRVPEQLELFPR